MKELKNFRAFLNEANPDGTVSQGEEKQAQAVIDQFTRQLMVEMNKAVKALEQVGGSFRSPGYKLDLYKAVDQIVNQFKPSYLAEGHSLSDSDIDYLEDFINRSSNEDNVILRRIIKNIIKTNIKPVKEQKTITEFVGKELEDRNEPLYDKLVPGQGDAETVEGEMLRAINRIVYRFYNDGDKYFQGYGTETAGPAHSFLVNANHPLKSAMIKLFDEPSGDNSYERMLKDVLDMILDYIESRQGKYTKNTLGGMFDYEPEFEEEEEDDDDYTYDYDDEDDY
tara:strand:+ start:3424 stop:4266 length:843 start_codon:yes stop_codon:yes gene_type:complete